MSTVINTNLASLFAQNSLANAQNNLATSVQRLSSGLRINSAKDDAAGLAISQNMQSQINGTNQSVRNLNDATNLLQTADTSLSSIHDMLLRLKQLATQGYDGSLSTSQKLDIVQEMKDLNNEINATAQRTQFNGIKLLTSGSSVDLVNSDLKTGASILTNASASPAVSAASNTFGATSALADTADTKIGGGGVATTYSIAIDSELSKYTPGTYTITSNGANVTLTGTFKGLAQSQTVTLADAVGNALGGSNKTINQTLNFSNFGIAINTTQVIGAGATQTGSQLATAISSRASTGTLVISGSTGEVTDVRLSGVAPGTYNLSYSGTGGVSTLGLPASLATALSSTTRDILLTGGSGSGATATMVTDSSGNVTSLSIRNAGSGYKAGDVLGAGTATAETSSAAFGTDLTSGQSMVLGGLTFTAGGSGATTAQVAAAFSNISVGGTGSSAFGTFTGALTGWSTGAANGSTVVFTSSTAADVGALSVSGSGAAPTLTVVAGGVSMTALSGIVVGSLASYNSNNLVMSGTVNGLATTQSLAVSTNAANTTQTFNFSSFGIQFDVTSYQEQNQHVIGAALATLNLGSSSGTYSSTAGAMGVPGQIIIGQGNNSALKFQSGPSSDAFIQIDTLNVQTGTSGSTAGQASEMMTLGTRISQTGTGNLGTLGTNDTIDTWQTAFKNAAAAVDNAIEYISTKRATFGSQMNRLGYVTTNLQAQSTNLQQSRSAMMDTDFAAETAKLTKGQIMQQAATAMLAQANQMPNVILSLLK